MKKTAFFIILSINMLYIYYICKGGKLQNA